MKDDFGRIIDYLRISLTDRCNFRCRYCMPSEGVDMLNHNDILTFEELIRLTEISVGLGVSKVRLTGGEPLVRKGITSFIRRLSSIEGIDNISMTTNGSLLEDLADELKNSGLNRLNISLDTVDREKFHRITRTDGLDKVLKGISAAKKAGFYPIKLNTVAVRGINDDEILDLAEYAAREGLILRFIEQMPFTADDQTTFMPAAEVLKILNRRYGSARELVDENRLISAGSGPAALYRFNNEGLTVGFITPVSNHFCSSCNRLRITADGKLKPCLLSEEEIDLKSILRNGSSDSVIRKILMDTICGKPEKHNLDENGITGKRGMSKIGG